MDADFSRSPSEGGLLDPTRQRAGPLLVILDSPALNLYSDAGTATHAARLLLSHLVSLVRRMAAVHGVAVLVTSPESDLFCGGRTDGTWRSHVNVRLELERVQTKQAMDGRGEGRSLCRARLAKSATGICGTTAWFEIRSNEIASVDVPDEDELLL